MKRLDNTVSRNRDWIFKIIDKLLREQRPGIYGLLGSLDSKLFHVYSSCLYTHEQRLG